MAVVLLSTMDPAALEWRTQSGCHHLEQKVLTAASVVLETHPGPTVPTQQLVWTMVLQSRPSLVAPVEDPRPPMVEAPRV